MWANNLQESVSATIKNNPWAQHLCVSLLIVLFLHWYSSSSPRKQLNRKEDIPDDLLLREEEIITRPRNARQSDTETSKIVRDINGKEAVLAGWKGATAKPSSTRQQQQSTHKKEETKKKERSLQRTPPISRPAVTSQAPPPFRPPEHNNRMQAYWLSHDTETSLFRVYEIAQRRTADEIFMAIPPFTPSSRRGNVRVGLRVTNAFTVPIEVYWMDYQGREIFKGQIFPRETWHQTTWIDHPWVFRQRQQLLLYYVPYRVIPTCDMASTVDENHSDVGIQQFTIALPRADTHACSIQDPILPFPAQHYLTTPQLAWQWALVHCTRMEFREWELLLQCGAKIIQHPDDAKYRSFRMANPQFSSRLWNTAARGVLLAGGFYENEGYVQFGRDSALVRNEIQDLSLWVWAIQKWMEQQLAERQTNDVQPTGADGYGRAGFGRAGQMNGNL